MAVGLYAGTFDPPTLGHLDIISRAAGFCDKLIVGVAHNPEKNPVFSDEERLRFLELECAGIHNVRVARIEGATVNFAKSSGVDVLVRGLRTSADLDNERAMAEVNKANGFESLFLLTAGIYAHVSSSIVRQAFAAGLSLKGLVTDNIAQALETKRLD